MYLFNWDLYNLFLGHFCEDMKIIKNIFRTYIIILSYTLRLQ